MVDDDATVRKVVADLLERNGYVVDSATNGHEALVKLETSHIDHVITDIDMPEMDGLGLIEEMKRRNIPGSVIVFSAYPELANLRKAMQLGADDFLGKPFHSVEAILFALQKVAERAGLKKENEQLRQEVEERFTFANMVAKSKKMSQIFDMIAKIADYKTTVLIIGESGTGKELIAKAIHYNSCRKNEPLVSVNCGGIPETLLESELFGHVKGAFTDAHRGKKGLFEEATGGTLFLDEIGELPLSLQVKLLRALQEEEIRPLGETRSVKVDVRIIAATARKLAEEVEHRRFRDDLFYRINVLTIEVPPLRERKEDIPLLLDHFIAKFNKRLGLQITGVDQEYLQRLLVHPWRGNVRELENVIERSMVLSEATLLTVRTLPPELFQPGRAEEVTDAILAEELSIKKNSKALEKRLIKKALEKTGGNKTQACQMLEISLPALLYKIKEFEL